MVGARAETTYPENVQGAGPPLAPATAAPEAPPGPPSQGTPPIAGRVGPGGWGLPLVVLIIGMFMSVLDTSIVNVAIPVIQKQFGVSSDQISWVSTSYSLCEGVMVAVSAWIGERFGLRRVYLYALVMFAAFSALCGLSTNLGMMVICRILQGVPGGVLPVTCLTMLYRLVPREKIGTAMGLYGLGVILAPGVGPTLGGYLVEYVDWRLIFYINVPVGILGAVAAFLVLPNVPSLPAGKFDLPGFSCIAAGLFAFLLAFSEGPTWGWTSYPTLILIAGAIDLLALFVVIELQSDHPVLDVRAFASWPFVNSLLLIATLSVGLFAVLFDVPLFLQNGQGLTPWHTGLTLLPQAIGMAVIMPISGRLYDRFGPRWPAIAGLTLAGGGDLLLTGINADMTQGELMLWLVIMTAGLALAMMPIMTSGISALSPEIVNSGSAFNTLTQRVASALGLAGLTALATSQQAQFMADRSALLRGIGANIDPRIAQMQAQGPAGLLGVWQQLQVEVQAQAYSDAFLIAGCCSLAGLALTIWLPSGRPARGDAAPAAH
jgi:EmrB/QacA subfamily drug resistance transporter